MRGLLGAIQFLTVIPMRTAPVPPAQAAVFFPLVGAAIGSLGAGVYLVLQPWFGTSMAALLTIAFWGAITGALHEDGLADSADAFRAYRCPVRILEILKDPRVGTFGVVALIFSILLRWQALTNLTTALLPSLVAVQVLPRAAMVVLAYISRPAGGGMGARFCESMTAPIAIAALMQALVAALWCGLRPGIVLLCAAAAIVLTARVFFERRLGGINGDCLGAVAQLTETSGLVLLGCPKCSW